MATGKALLMSRADRWKDILHQLKFGADCGVECKHRKKNDVYVTVMGRVMTIGEASDLSGICNDFFKSYPDICCDRVGCVAFIFRRD